MTTGKAKPKRVQKSRQRKGSMLGAVYVGRAKGKAGRWGNPFAVGHNAEGYKVITAKEHVIIAGHFKTKEEALARCLEEYRRFALDAIGSIEGWIEPLRGKNLGCWCPLDKPCHADILLELANREPSLAE